MKPVNGRDDHPNLGDGVAACTLTAAFLQFGKRPVGELLFQHTAPPALA